MANGWRFSMTTFKRGLSKECNAALQALSREKGHNWWKDVLASNELLLAVRGGYLNAYARGQSIFKIGSEHGNGMADGKPRVAIHFKYLIKRNLEQTNSYIPFDGSKFDIPADVAFTQYKPGSTLPILIRTASRFAGAEKTGLHRIVAKESRVADLEIAFTQSDGSGQRATHPRMDLAVLIPWNSGGARLVFCEAKCADNAELWKPWHNAATGDKSVAIAWQIAKYETFIQKQAKSLIAAYQSVCQTLVYLRRQGWSRELDPLVEKVGIAQVSLTIHPYVYLLVYGFDADQKKGALKQHLKLLNGMLGRRVIAKGNADSFRLSEDILRRERLITQSR
jgi:hypothetical protein